MNDSNQWYSKLQVPNHKLLKRKLFQLVSENMCDNTCDSVCDNMCENISDLQDNATNDNADSVMYHVENTEKELGTMMRYSSFKNIKNYVVVTLMFAYKNYLDLLQNLKCIFITAALSQQPVT